MNIAEAAERKVVVDLEVPQFHLRPAADVAGEQTDHHVIPALQGFQQLGHAGQDAALVANEVFRQQGEVCLAEAFQVFGRRLDAVGRKQVFGNGHVRPARVGHVDANAVQAESSQEGLFHRRFARPAAGQERAVDVEEEDVLGLGRWHRAIIAASAAAIFR